MNLQAKMGCQNCIYANQDSTETDLEIYKKGDDTKVLIEPQTPLIERVPYSYPINSVRKIRKQKRVLSSLDILISIFIVTPCVVGCWRGIWQIMDIYAVYFPAWESFIIGSATHIVLALGQDVFHHVVVEKETTNPVLRIFALFLMKFYIITFNVITNLIWRGAWILFDHYCGLRSSDSGIALWEGSSSAIWFTIVCSLLLFCMKGLKNTISPPFSVALDSKDEVFLFSTRYIYKVTYIAVTVFIKETVIVEDTPQTAEQLLSSQSIQVETFQNQPPRPFGIKVLGPPPQEFTPTTSTTTPTTMKAPSTNYPQLNSYRNNYQPKNIQEILGYINKPRSYKSEMLDKSQKDKERQASNQEGFKQSLIASSGFSSDPFYPYKPSDPSEINLLATASLRFAPPAWRSLKKLYQQPIQQPRRQVSNSQQVDTSNIQETIRNFAKPFVVTLNIFPGPGEDQVPVFGRQRAYSQGVQDGVPHEFQGDPRARTFNDRGSKMTIRLNIFPESISPFSGQEEKSAESNVNRVRFV